VMIRHGDDQTWSHGDDDQRLEPRHGDDHGDMVMIRHGGLVMMIRDWSPDMVMIRHGGMVMMIRDWSPDMVMIMVTW